MLFKKPKDKKKIIEPPKRYSKLQIISSGIGAGILITLFSIISLPLGIMMIGFSAGISGFLMERYSRKKFEYNAAQRFQALENNIDGANARININREDINHIQKDVHSLKLFQKVNNNKSTKRDANILGKIKKSTKYMDIAYNNREKPSETLEEKTENKDPNYNAEDYNHISDIVVKELLHHAVDHDRIEVFVQPVVRLPQRQIRYYEVFARIRAKAGLYIPASRYMPIAEQDKLDSVLDRILLLHCLKTIEQSASIEKATPFFININSRTLQNGDFMKRLLAFAKKNRQLAPRLIFEISQNDFENLSDPLLEIIKGLGVIGCNFSLDHVDTTRPFDIQRLQKHKVRFVKISAEHFLSASTNIRAMRAKSLLESLGIHVILERVENEKQIRRLLDHEPQYGQGYLFGKPDIQGAYKDKKRIRREGYKEDVIFAQSS